MSNTLKSYPVAAIPANTGGAAYTVPASTTATLIGCSIANNSSTAVITVNVQLKRSGNFYNWVPPGASIPVGGSLQVVGVEGKMVLQAADVLVITPIGGTVDTIVSVLEQA